MFASCTQMHHNLILSKVQLVITCKTYVFPYVIILNNNT